MAADETRRDHDHQLGLFAFPVRGAEQGAQDRDIARARDLAQGLGVAVLEQAGDGEALAVAQGDGGGRAADGQGRNAEALQGHAIVRVQLADLRLDLQFDHAIGVEGGREVQLHAELAVFHGHAVLAVGHRNRDFSAGEEAGLLARQGRQVRLGQGVGVTLLLQGMQSGGQRPGPQTRGQLQNPSRRLRADQALGGGEDDAAAAVGGQVDADVVQGRAIDLDDAHVQADLLGVAHHQGRGDALGRHAFGQGHGALGHGRRGGAAGQQHAIGQVRHPDMLAGQGQGDVFLQTGGVVTHPHIDHPGQLQVAVIDQHIGGAAALAADVEALVGGGDDLGNVRLGDDDLAGGNVQMERGRLVLGHVDRLAGGGLQGDRVGPAGQGRQGQHGAGQHQVRTAHAQTPPCFSEGAATSSLLPPWTICRDEGRAAVG